MSTPRPARILMVHNRYRIRGGEDESFDAECALLRDNGHEVVEHVLDNEAIDRLGLVRTALGTVWSPRSYRAIQAVVDAEHPELVHVQNFFPLASPSVHHAAKSRGLPVVQTLRNYRLMCVNGLFFRAGRVCEDCLDHAVPWPAVRHSCYRDSPLGSATVAAMQLTHRALGTWREKVDRFVTLTEFARSKFVRLGWPADRIVVKPNFVPGNPDVGDGGGGFLLFVGRLCEQKGIRVLLDALERTHRSWELRVVGDGELSQEVARRAAEIPGVTLLGRRSREEVMRLMARAAALVFPSLSYETFGRVATEAFAVGTPVIASRIGALAELMEDERCSVLFEPGDAVDLARKLDALGDAGGELKAMRSAARHRYEEHYTAARNYELLRSIYDDARKQAGR